ncbi:hypothetical protein [Achromobacter xylosoxidans]|uniref:hypothetical protein n=1 Tax=Alcaligenes xylosoxydans xylosoxydans TaxID=85698 RepID=UPI0006BFBB83|nr:hypothetical protein [Achromobacter xylosoxidans]MCH4575751.1 hypothetical protein [Achromobacter xylosoxidans]MDD7991217.1 hypothetical protein [Achromobacter xylosoxidans]NEV07998.1 hypothetical protein [Achromobacter xylosoxidans]OFO62514.1 hypothetical protein HMPREF3024_20150 [Achromobacter xylosoxidans]OMG86188.1 hypothetical protein BIZ53_22780 [Achromobacter xylosoxidans]
MSEHHQFIFPRYPHLPPPDWPALQARLLAGGYLLEPRGDRVPREALDTLSLGLAGLKEGSFQYREGLRTTGDVIALYQSAGHLPPEVPVRHHDTMEETLALLAAHGIVPDPSFDDESSNWRSPHFCLGPAARALLNPGQRAHYDADPTGFSVILLAYDGPEPYVGVGENLEMPSLPGSDEPLEELPPFGSHVDFIGAAYEDPAVRWRNPADGRDYHLFDLDWHFSMALGFRMIRANCLEEGSAEALARLVGELVGQPMACSHRHL